MSINIYKIIYKYLVLIIIAVAAATFYSQQLPAQPSASSISVYFSPNGGIRDKIISKINLSRKSIKIAIYSFTSGDIAWALENAKKRGVNISIIADKVQSNGKNSEISYLISNCKSV